VSLQHVASSISGFCDNCKSGRGSTEEEDKREPQQLLSFTETHAAYKTVKSLFYLPSDAQKSCFKRILKFTLKQRLHVSVQSPSSGSVLFELAKVIVIKIIS
jgi:hypothetical protein